MATIVLGDTRLNVPDGLSPEDHDEIVDDYVSRRMREAGVMSPDELAQVNAAERAKKHEATLEGMGEFDRQRAATGAGFANIGRNVANIALPRSMQEKFGVTDEDLGRATERDQPLAEAEKFSYLAGEVAPALPFGASTLPRAVASGAGFGGILGGPENRGQGAALGAVLGAGGHGLARSVGRTAGRGIVHQTPEAQRLHQAGVYAPLAKAADSTAGGATSTVRAAYEHLVPFFPTARAALDKQAKQLGVAGAKAVEKADIFKGGLTIADDFKSVMSEGISQKSNIMFRNWFYKLGNALGPVLSFGTLGAFRGMATQGFQKFLMGSTKWQEAINKALKAGDAQRVQQTIGQAARAYAIAEGIE